ncbi:MAG TPA: acyltransferase, partial [Bacteroidia bacterium]|nr:acyltransferase [Bacteroidia bacterium]
ILNGVNIGENCNICDHCFIESQVSIGNNVTIKSGIYIWAGTTIEDDVFLGPNVVFTNDIRPRSKQFLQNPVPTLVQKGASIGANSTILAGITIGKYAMCGIGSVVTRDVKNYALVFGNPARQQGWVNERGEKLQQRTASLWESTNGDIYKETSEGLKPHKKQKNKF